MKNRDEMVNDLLERRDKYVAEQKRKRNILMRSTAAAVCVCLVASAGVWIWHSKTRDTTTAGTEQTKTEREVETVPNNSEPTISLDGLPGQDIGYIYALYDKGYDTIEKLLKVSDLIVRATPVAIESKSAAGCHVVLRVEDADRDGITVLQKDFDNGYYFVPGGGDGIFRTDVERGQIKGKLLDSLAEKTHTDKSKLTFEDIFDLLVKNK